MLLRQCFMFSEYMLPVCCNNFIIRWGWHCKQISIRRDVAMTFSVLFICKLRTPFMFKRLMNIFLRLMLFLHSHPKTNTKKHITSFRRSLMHCWCLANRAMCLASNAFTLSSRLRSVRFPCTSFRTRRTCLMQTKRLCRCRSSTSWISRSLCCPDVSHMAFR